MTTYLTAGVIAASLAACAAAAPTPRAPTGPAVTQTVNLGATAGRTHKVTPTAIVEDSRCPPDVRCIQAGTVRIAARLTAPGMKPARRAMTLTAPVTYGGATYRLVQVCPGAPASGRPAIAASRYRFTFEIGRGPASETAATVAPARPC